MRRNLTTILRLEKFRPLAAENGRVGVALAKKEKPDLILCDVMMPELDGYGVIAALRADAATVSIPFIFLTAKGEKPDIRAGMNLGADDYLTKPVAKPDLLAAIQSRLERAIQQAVPEFKPNFSSARPLEIALGLTPRVAETLLWLAQGKTACRRETVAVNGERKWQDGRSRTPNPEPRKKAGVRSQDTELRIYNSGRPNAIRPEPGSWQSPRLELISAPSNISASFCFAVRSSANREQSEYIMGIV
jgi:CheY-like chemotaxis protein